MTECTAAYAPTLQTQAKSCVAHSRLAFHLKRTRGLGFTGHFASARATRTARRVSGAISRRMVWRRRAWQHILQNLFRAGMRGVCRHPALLGISMVRTARGDRTNAPTVTRRTLPALLAERLRSGLEGSAGMANITAVQTPAYSVKPQQPL